MTNIRPGAVLIVISTRPIPIEAIARFGREIKASVAGIPIEWLRRVIGTFGLAGIVPEPFQLRALADRFGPEVVKEVISDVLASPYTAEQHFVPAALKTILPIAIERSILPRVCVYRAIRIIASPRIPINPPVFRDALDEELYRYYLDAHVDLLRRLVEDSDYSPAYRYMDDALYKISKFGLPAAITGALFPHVWAAYKLTTARTPEDVDLITQFTLKNPLGATIGSAAVFGLTPKLIKKLLKRSAELPSIGSEFIKSASASVGSLIGADETVVGERLDRLAAELLPKIFQIENKPQ